VLAPTPVSQKVDLRLKQLCVVDVRRFTLQTSCVLVASVFLLGSYLKTTGHTVHSPPSLGVRVL